MACVWALAAGMTAAAGADDTWVPLGALPAPGGGPVFALAADPADGHRLLAGTSGGVLLRSADGGATWRAVRSGLGRGVSALAFVPGQPGAVLAGTRGAGVWLSADDGLTWQRQAGTAGQTVRAFAFAGNAVLAGADQGVLVSQGGGPWAPAGLAQVHVSALAVSGGAVTAGGDATRGSDPLPLYVSGDAGQTWAPAPGVAGPDGAAAVAGSSMVTALSAPAGGPLLMGTNAGLFASADRGATWQQLTGGGVLPGTDFTSLAAAPRHPERFYAASDGGASDRGGLWVSADDGAHFTTLAPPEPEVTALAVTADDVPQLVLATFRPLDHAVALWTYRDAGGQPSAAVGGPAPGAPPATAGAGPAAPVQPVWRAFLARPETPYVLIGLAALLAVVAALVSYVRRGRVG
jgi:hypothetical protein